MRRARGGDGTSRQDGFSLVEVLVVVALVGLVSTLVTSAVIDGTKVTRVASAGLMSQSQLLDAVSRVTRDISIATEIVNTRSDEGWQTDSPSPSDVTIESLRDDGCVRTRYWVESNEDATEGTLQSETEEFAAEPCPEGTGARLGVVTATVVRALNLGTPVFSYFDSANDFLVPATVGTVVALGTVDGAQVARIGLDVGSSVAGRPNGVRLQTSAVPRSADPNAEPRDVGTPGPTTCEATLHPVPAPQISTTGQVSWLGVAGARGYSVLRSDGASTNVPEGSALVWVQSALVPYKGYTFEVYPYNSQGFALTAAQCSFTAAIQLRGRTFVAGTDGVDNDNELTWDRSETAASYILYRDGVPLVTLGSSVVRYVDVNRPWGATNTYSLTGLDEEGDEGPKSNLVTLRIRPPAPRITGLSFVANDNNPDNVNNGRLFCASNFTNNNCAFDSLGWQPATGWTPPAGSTYQVYRNGVLLSSTSTLSFKNYSGVCGVRNSYTVTVTVPFNGTSDPAPLVDVNSFPCPPVLTAAAFAANPDGVVNDVRLTWNTSLVSPTYEVFRGSTLIGTLTATSFVDSNRPAGSTTTYYVRATNSAGRGTSNVVSALAAPAAPLLSAFLPGDNSTSWAWLPVTGASSYNVYSRPIGQGSFSLLAVLPSSTWLYTADAQVAQRTYEGYVVACNSVGCSPGSTTGQATPTSAYRTAVLADGPRGYWRLGNLLSTGTAVTPDETANANSLTYVTGGSPGVTTNFPVGLDSAVGALALDENHALNLPDNNDVVRGDFRRSVTGSTNSTFNALSNITMEAWVYLDGTEHGMFMRAGDCATQSSATTGNPCSGYGMGVGGNRTTGVPSSQVGWNANGAPFLNDGNRTMALTERCGWQTGLADVPAPIPGWHHVVLTVDSVYVGKLYQDGVLLASFLRPSQTCLQTAVGFFHLGGYQYTYDAAGAIISRYFSGQIDESAYYAKVLTPTQIAQHYYLGRYCSTVVGVVIADCG